MSGRVDTHIAERDAIESVLADHPVQLAVLFGSTVNGHTHPHSDLDLAVEFEPSVSDVGTARLSLLTDLSILLETNEIDLAVLSDLDPRVGYAATTEGVLLCGSSERLEEQQDRFARELDEREMSSPRDRFDAVLDRINGHLED